MKNKIMVCFLALLICFLCFFFHNTAYCSNEKIINNKTESTLVEIKDEELKSLEHYEKAYGSKSYGYTAYILRKVQIYSIPFTILGIIIGAAYDYVLGARHLETKEKGMALMISFITIGVICQVLPLVFTIVVKFGRE